MIEIGFELLPVAFQNSRGVSRWIGGDAQEQIVVHVLCPQGALDTGELRCQKRANIRACCEYESRQYDVSLGIREAERLAVLIHKGKIGYDGLSCLASDFRPLRRNGQMRKCRTDQKAQQNRRQCEQMTNAQL